MRKPRRQFAILLATVVALRALVPLGYMLEAGGERLFDLALILCPQQNPALDLSRLDGPPSGSHAHHDHHVGAGDAGHTEGLAHADIATGIDNTCQLWSGSANAVLAAHTQAGLTGLRIQSPPRAGHDTPFLRAQRTAAARAPPAALIA